MGTSRKTLANHGKGIAIGRVIKNNQLKVLMGLIEDRLKSFPKNGAWFNWARSRSRAAYLIGKSWVLEGVRHPLGVIPQHLSQQAGQKSI